MALTVSCWARICVSFQYSLVATTSPGAMNSDGRFVAPIDGVYWVSCYLRLTEGIPDVRMELDGEIVAAFGENLTNNPSVATW